MEKDRQTFTASKLQKITDIVVKKFIQNGSLYYDDFEDVKQSVMVKYYSKQKTIEAAYSGAAKVETYLSAVVYRMVLEILRSKTSLARRKLEYEDHSKLINNNKPLNPEEETIIKNEVVYLNRILLTLGKEKDKIFLFLKYYFKLKIKLIDLGTFVKSELRSKILEILKNTIPLKDKEIYEKLCEVQLIVEQKITKIDAIRMYINKNIDKIISLLNANERAFYTKETLRILFEKI